MNPIIELSAAILVMAVLAALLVRVVRARLNREKAHPGLTHLPARTGLPGMRSYE